MTSDGRAQRIAVAVGVGVLVAALGVWAQNAALVGINYDDGIYALLAKAVASGQGYRLTHLPMALPGIKYPPVYPLSLVPFWALADSQEAALYGMKLANGLCIGVAAGLFAFLLSALRIVPTWLAGLVAVVGFAAGSMMLVTAGLLSEPLYLVLLFATLWVADGGAGKPGVRRLAAAGLLGALTALTRAVGVAAIAALAIGLWRRSGWRAALVSTGCAVVGLIPWLAFTLANASEVPTVLVPRYGSYLQLYLTNLAGSLWSALDIFAINVGAILQTLGAKLVPQLGEPFATAGGAALIALAALGSLRVFRKAPTTTLYPWIYLALVSSWSFPPFRFVFILFPMLLALAVVSWPVLAERVGSLARRATAPAVSRKPTLQIVIIALGALGLANLGYSEARAIRHRVWDGGELEKSESGRELIDWVRSHTEPDAVIAYEFDPLVALHTGRKTVPNNYEPVHVWYRTSEPAVEPLARLFAEVGVDYVAVRGNIPLAARTIDSLLEQYPASLDLRFITAHGVMIFAASPEAFGTGDVSAAETGAEKLTAGGLRGGSPVERTPTRGTAE